MTDTADRTQADRRTSALTGGLLVSGGLLAVLGNLLHPRFTQDNRDELYRAVNLSDRLLVADLVLIPAILLVTAGLVELGHLLGRRGAPALGRLARTAAVAGGAVAVLQFVVEGYAFKQAAHIFALTLTDEQNKIGAFYSTAAVERINTAMFSTWTMILLGVTPLLLVAAMWLTRSFPSWLSIAGGVGAVVCLLTALINIAREDQSTLLLLVFLVGSLLVTCWVIATGGLLLKAGPRSGRSAPS